jgi:hypothetical protein
MRKSVLVQNKSTIPAVKKSEVPVHGPDVIKLFATVILFGIS